MHPVWWCIPCRIHDAEPAALIEKHHTQLMYVSVWMVRRDICRELASLTRLPVYIYIYIQKMIHMYVRGLY